LSRRILPGAVLARLRPKWENAILALTPTTGDDLPRIRFSSIKKGLDFPRVHLDALGDGKFVPCLDRLQRECKFSEKTEKGEFSEDSTSDLFAGRRAACALSSVMDGHS
jgi:hypothetical protein